MNKKKINGLLIFLMLIIWGLVLNKFFNFYNSENKVVDSFVNVNETDFNFKFSKDTFDLKKIQRDPFLGNIGRERKVISGTNISEQKKSSKIVIGKISIDTKKEEKIVWPKVNYYGQIKGIKSSSEFVLIKIDNKLHNLKEGARLGIILVEKVYRDSIRIKINTESKIIFKNK